MLKKLQAKLHYFANSKLCYFNKLYINKIKMIVKMNKRKENEQDHMEKSRKYQLKRIYQILYAL